MAHDIKSQKDQRVSDGTTSGEVYFDQHQRLWHAEVEKESRAPCGPYTPINWDAPWLPPQTSIRFERGKRHTDAQGMPVRLAYDIRIDYDGLLAEYDIAGRQWDEDALRRTVALHGDTWDRTKGVPKDVQVTIGQRPGHLLPVVEAASQGHPYILGLRPLDVTKPKDVELQQYLERRKGRSITNWLDDEDTKPTVAKARAGKD